MPDQPETLNEYLKEFREDTKGTPDELKQADIALAIGASQSLISKIERGLARLDRWEPERLYKLLLAWRQTPAQMLHLADRYDLRDLAEYIRDTRQMAGVTEGPKVRYLGVVSAGMLGANEVLDNGHAKVSAPDVIAEQVDAARLPPVGL